jgi:PAS domain S-box-containing protein
MQDKVGAQALEKRLSRFSGTFFMMAVDAHGNVLQCNRVAERLLGRSSEDLAGIPLSALLASDASASIEQLLRANHSTETSVGTSLVFNRADQSGAPLLVSAARSAEGHAEHGIWLIGLDDTAREQYIRELESRAEMLSTFIDASSEAIWGMEFIEPVNLQCSAPEIVRQVFENLCQWRMCNAAMARMYNLPEGVDFNQQPVRQYFRRTPENEAFVAKLVDAQFHLDGVESLEYGHDGQPFHVQNNVRCHIENGQLYWMWGTLRDVTQIRRTENALVARQREVTDILTALPDAVLVVDLMRRALALNPAFESTFGWTAEDILGKDISQIVALDPSRPGPRRWFASSPSRLLTTVMSARGEECKCDVRVAPLPATSGHRFVMSFRPIESRHKGGLGSNAANRAVRKPPARGRAKSRPRGTR